MNIATAFNWFEVVLWGTLGVTFAVKAVGREVANRSFLLGAAVGFSAFAVSDVVEIQTGAWWRPWWLFVWKAACVSLLVGLAVAHYRRTATTDTHDDIDGAGRSADS